MSSNDKIILKDCMTFLKQKLEGLFWIEILKEVNKNYGHSINSIIKIIFCDLIKVDKVDYSANGFFQFNNKKQCSLKWIISTNTKNNYVQYLFDVNKIPSTTNIKSEIENVTIENLLNYNIINDKIYRIFKVGKITTLKELNNHISRHNNFLNVRGCDNKCNYDILQIYEDYCIKLIGNQEQEEQNKIVNKKRRNNKISNVKNIKITRKKVSVVATIRETFNAKLLSTNAYNICKVLNIKDTYELKSFIDLHKNFLMIKNCTKKENEQLLRLNILYNS